MKWKDKDGNEYEGTVEDYQEWKKLENTITFMDEYGNKITATQREINEMKRPILNSKTIRIGNKVYDKSIVKKSHKTWTPEEDKIIETYYETEGSNIINRINGRTINAIRGRVQMLRKLSEKPSELKVRYRKILNGWTTEEDEIVRKYYPSEHTNCAFRLPKRTKKAIELRASKLRVFVNTKMPKTQTKRFYPGERHKFTKAEERIIRNEYNGNNAIELAEKLGLTPHGVSMKAWQLKHHKKILRHNSPEVTKKYADRARFIANRANSLMRQDHSMSREKAWSIAALEWKTHNKFVTIRPEETVYIIVRVNDNTKEETILNGTYTKKKDAENSAAEYNVANDDINTHYEIREVKQ